MSKERDVAELLDIYMDQENLTRLEGRKGVEALCQIAGALGYKDPLYFGQLTNKATVGDLLAMLEDNSGLIEAMLEWIQSRNFSEFREPLEALVGTELASEHYKDCPDCFEEVNPEARIGDACDNCGHVFNLPVGTDDDSEWDEMEPLFPNGVPEKL